MDSGRISSKVFKSVLITGSSGFVGKALIQRALADERFKPIAAIRSDRSKVPSAVELLQVPDLSSSSVDLVDRLHGVDSIVHLAGLAHIVGRKAKSAQDMYYRVNRDATVNLALQAHAAGVKRFVFVSSIGVHGSTSHEALTESSPIAPLNAYADSKLQAEKALLDVAERRGMEVVIIRPPLIVGPGAPGNLDRLRKAIVAGVPLPLGGIANKRSFIGVRNLCDLILKCVADEMAANEVFVVGNDEVVSTTDVCILLGEASNIEPRLFWMPAELMRCAAAVAGMSAMVDQLWGSLTVDSSKAKSHLDWHPKYSLKDEIAGTAV